MQFCKALCKLGMQQPGRIKIVKPSFLILIITMAKNSSNILPILSMIFFSSFTLLLIISTGQARIALNHHATPNNIDNHRLLHELGFFDLSAEHYNKDYHKPSTFGEGTDRLVPSGPNGMVSPDIPNASAVGTDRLVPGGPNPLESPDIPNASAVGTDRLVPSGPDPLEPPVILVHSGSM
ncbi:hypothetical protein WN944_010074 [Citrus x changshan-huyou]|uniref:Uncharacterized protein n=1 Tax=Citrus x changshan-huyou TaxID=2935761 RepID=A0AAP0MXA7_9ROSI